MQIELERADGTKFAVEVAPPTMSRRDAIRNLTSRLMTDASAIDEKFKKLIAENQESGKDFTIAYSSEVDIFKENSIIENFKLVVNRAQISDADQKYFKENTKEVKEFWRNQNLKGMNAAITFFREN